VASPVEWHAAVPGGETAQRQTTHTQQCTGPPSCGCPYPERQSGCAGHQLYDTPAAGAGSHGLHSVTANTAALRRGGAARDREAWQEENCRGVSVTTHVQELCDSLHC
jgi:hypothetical protein